MNPSCRRSFFSTCLSGNSPVLLRHVDYRLLPFHVLWPLRKLRWQMQRRRSRCHPPRVIETVSRSSTINASTATAAAAACCFFCCFCFSCFCCFCSFCCSFAAAASAAAAAAAAAIVVTVVEGMLRVVMVFPAIVAVAINVNSCSRRSHGCDHRRHCRSSSSSSSSSS